MRILSILALLTSASAFAPAIQTAKKTSTQLDVHRRDFLFSGLTAGLIAAPSLANAAGSTFFFDDKIEEVRVPAQMGGGANRDKVDINSAFVGDYKVFRGMFPHAAGQIASHGPYNTVSDIYKIEGLSDSDKKMFKKYDKYFTAGPPDPRSVDERINARVST